MKVLKILFFRYLFYIYVKMYDDKSHNRKLCFFLSQISVYYTHKYFFSSHVGTADGGECSSTAIRAMIKKLIADEQARKPLSDSKIADLLGNEGIQVARRTVAKYREAMSIASSTERKRLA